MSDNEKALWLINSERQARGVMPLHGFDSNVTSVAQGYADFLLSNDEWGHDKDGTTKKDLSGMQKLITATMIINCGWRTLLPLAHLELVFLYPWSVLYTIGCTRI